MAEFVELLHLAQVGLIVDVRTIPRSRTNPQYNFDTLPQTLSQFQIGYEHIAELGGLRGKKQNVSPIVNAFWRNQSFHNYADYTLSETFHAGFARLRLNEALALIETKVFDAAMLDMNLNGNKSHDVADALAVRGVPFVFSTGYSNLEMKDAYRDRPVLKKPFPYEVLVEVLTRSAAGAIILQ